VCRGVVRYRAYSDERLSWRVCPTSRIFGQNINLTVINRVQRGRRTRMVRVSACSKRLAYGVQLNEDVRIALEPMGEQLGH
jgi:hypothetical protein